MDTYPDRPGARWLLLGYGLAVSWFVSGCGVIERLGSCDIPSSQTEGVTLFCADYGQSTYTSELAQEDCSNASGTYHEHTRCSTENLVGKCVVASGLIQYFYSPDHDATTAEISCMFVLGAFTEVNSAE